MITPEELLVPGLYPQVSMHDYLTLPYLSSGLCNVLLASSPRHARFTLDNREPDDTEASDVGTAIHDALLEGLDRIQPIDALDWRTKSARDARDAARASGKIPMLAVKVDQVKHACEAAREFLAGTQFAGVLERGRPEQTIVWKEESVLCKARLDWLADARDVLIHVKTTKGSAGPLQFTRAIDNMGYDLALAFYERGLATIAAARCHHVILAIEQQPPYGCALYDLDPAKAALAAGKVERAIAIWRNCAATGRWPSYSPRVHSVEPKPWELAEEERLSISRPFTESELQDGIPL
jgi:PDDEXK-like domain of unknown function (DUF3799)